MQNISSFIPIFTSINLPKKCGYKISTHKFRENLFFIDKIGGFLEPWF